MANPNELPAASDLPKLAAPARRALAAAGITHLAQLDGARAAGIQALHALAPLRTALAARHL